MEEKKDYIVIRLFGNVRDKEEVCILTTRGDIVSRHKRADVKSGKEIPGLRRYITPAAAHRKALNLNIKYKTFGFGARRADLEAC